MEKLTKKQHREIITNLINENHNVKDLRNIQQVTEIFKEDAELRKEGSVLVAADAIRLLMDLLDMGYAQEVDEVLCDFKEKIQEGLDGDNIYTKIDEMLHQIDVKQVLFIKNLLEGYMKKKGDLNEDYTSVHQVRL